MNRTYEEWIKYYENATKEQVIEDTMHDMEEINRLNNIIKELSKDVDMWNRKYNEQFNIIKNLDKMFEYYFLGNLKYDQDTVNTIYIKYVQLKELKEGKE